MELTRPITFLAIVCLILAILGAFVEDHPYVPEPEFCPQCVKEVKTVDKNAPGYRPGIFCNCNYKKEYRPDTWK